MTRTQTAVRGLVTGLAVLWSNSPALADAPSLSLPIDCTLGETCYIQQFTDHDPGPGAQDFTCGTLSYDGHKGTDFALPTLVDQALGVAVLAAAAGTVTATRNDMPDASPGTLQVGDISGRECGNGVVLRHESGWETQYCHLAEGSVTVSIGDIVAIGAPLGMVGLSGQTEFPHLHLSVRHRGAVIDPFAPDDRTSCGPRPVSDLWQTELPAPPGGLIRIGLTGSIPDYADITHGTMLPALSAQAPLVGWALYFGSRDGDQLHISLVGPQGLVSETTEDLTRRARGYLYSGRRAPEGGWPAGSYMLIVTHLRGATILGEAVHAATLP